VVVVALSGVLLNPAMRLWVQFDVIFERGQSGGYAASRAVKVGLLATPEQYPLFFPESVGMAPNLHGTMLSVLWCMVVNNILGSVLWLRYNTDHIIC
jgi:hypothetical protein